MGRNMEARNRFKVDGMIKARRGGPMIVEGVDPAIVAQHLERLRAEGKLDRFVRQEPRCRICRDDDVRMLVNKLLGYKPMGLRLADILRILEPVNEGRSKTERVTYDSLWVHSKRHYDIQTPAAAIWRAIKLDRELRHALGDNGV